MPGKPLLIRFVEGDGPSVVVSQGHVKMWSTHDIKDDYVFDGVTYQTNGFTHAHEWDQDIVYIHLKRAT